MQPIERGDQFEDPLDEALKKSGLGEVRGGGTQLGGEPASIEFCNVEIRVADYSDTVINTLVQHLIGLGAPKGSKLILEDGNREVPLGVAEGLALFLNGTELPDEVYENSDVDHVIEECNRLLADRGNFRGHWNGSLETDLYLYGTSFDQMTAAIQPFVAKYPPRQKSRIERIA